MKNEWTYRQAYSNGEPTGYVVQDGPANPICDVATEELAQLIAAAPTMYTACDAADTAFAVLQISELTPQARGCVREAWPLVQEALAAARPGGVYAEVIKDAHQHEIKRLDGKLKERDAEIERIREALRIIANQSWVDEEEKLEAADFMRQHARGIVRPPKPYTGSMDPDCFYAKSCGFDSGTCPVCKERRQVPADGIYYSDELGQPDAEKEN